MKARLASALVCSLMSAPAALGAAPQHEGEGFIKFKDEASLARFLRTHSGAARLHAALLWVKHDAKTLARLDAAERPDASGIIPGSFSPNQSYFVPPARPQERRMERIEALPNALWGISRVNAERAWTVTRGAADVLVAVADTGIDYNHRALKDRMAVNDAEKDGAPGVDDDGNGYVDDVYGYDFYNKDGDPIDDEGHGSHVAGTIAGNAAADNFYGVAPEVKLLAVKTHSRSGAGTEEAVVKGILYAADRGARVINCSWGGAPEAPAYSQVLFDAISYANQKGAILVAAAGNDGRNNDRIENYPANYKVPNVLAVASTGRNDNLSFFSNYGAQNVHVAAPGSDIHSVDLGGGYVRLSGTSMAAPHASGAAAIVLSATPGLSPEQVKAKLMLNAERLRSLDGRVVSGLIDLSFISEE